MLSDQDYYEYDPEEDDEYDFCPLCGAYLAEGEEHDWDCPDA